MISSEYVAGIFDGEGCVTTSRQFIKGKYEKYPRVRMQICIANCHTGLLKEITKWFGGGYTDKNGKNRKMPCFSWRITGKKNMTCKMCGNRGKTWKGSDRTCYFDAPEDNWVCATVGAIRDIVYEGQELPAGVHYEYCDDEGN